MASMRPAVAVHGRLTLGAFWPRHRYITFCELLLNFPPSKGGNSRKIFPRTFLVASRGSGPVQGFLVAGPQNVLLTFSISFLFP